MFNWKYEMKFLVKVEKIDGELREKVEVEEYLEKLSALKARASLLM